MTAFTFLYPVCKPAFCGAITYALDGGNTSYLSFDPSPAKLTLLLWSKSESDLKGGVQTPYDHKIRAYPCDLKQCNFKQNTIKTGFVVTLDPLCALSEYTASRPGIPALVKYEIGKDPALNLPFFFNFKPTSCKTFKAYTATVKKCTVYDTVGA